MASLLKLKNNAVARLNAAITTSSVTLALVPGQGARFPTLAAGEFFPVTLIAVDGTMEVAWVTARATDSLTVTRAQEGTAAAAFAIADRVELRLSGGALQYELDRMASLLAGKADASTVAGKADAAATTAALATKADATTTTTALGLKANSADVLAKAGGTMTGPLVLADGLQATPSLTFAGSSDSDTGFFHISDGIIGIVCNGVLVGRFLSTGFEAIKLTQTT